MSKKETVEDDEMIDLDDKYIESIKGEDWEIFLWKLHHRPKKKTPHIQPEPDLLDD
jgi:hypothetical protein